MTSENLERWKRIPGISACDEADRNPGEKRSGFEVRCILFRHARETCVSHQVEALMSSFPFGDTYCGWRYFIKFQNFFQADQRFVWNGHLLRELSAQPEVMYPYSNLLSNCNTYLHVLK